MKIINFKNKIIYLFCIRKNILKIGNKVQLFFNCICIVTLFKIDSI